MFPVEHTDNKTSYLAPVMLGFREHSTCADECTLSVVLLSTVPAFTQANCGCTWSERIRMCSSGFEFGLAVCHAITWAWYAQRRSGVLGWCGRAYQTRSW